MSKRLKEMRYKEGGVVNRVLIGIISGTCSTTASTIAKAVTIDDYVLTAGDFLAIKFTYGNSAASPTLNINGAGAKNIRLGTTNASAITLTLGANATILLYFDGAYFQMTGSFRATDSDTTYSAASTAEIAAGTDNTKFVTPSTRNTVQATPIPTTLVANQSYYGTLAANLTIATLTASPDGQLSEWHFVAIMGATAYTIAFTPTIKWATALPTFAANKTYEFSIIKVGATYLGCWVVY